MANQEPAVMDTTEEFSKLKVVELKKLLKDRGLSVTGTKDELIERLKQANEAAEKKLLEEITEETPEGEATAASIDEELENEIMNDENKVTSTSIVKPGEKRKPAENGSTENTETPAKKIDSGEDKENAAAVLKDETELSKDTETAESNESSKKIIKLSTITPEEKKELRVKKFGLTEEEKKEARAKRFGITAESTSSDIKKVKITTAKVNAAITTLNKDIDAMKKRAERFGLLGNQKLTPEEEEKRKKRAERFGINAQQTVTLKK